MIDRLINKKVRIALIALLVASFIAVAIWYISGLSIDILNPKGVVATKQYNLLVFTTLLGFIVVIPVFIMAIVIAWRYRENNHKARYTPNASTNKLAETIWWGIPIVLIIILSVVTWTSTHDLDPHKPLVSDVPAVNIQVVALDWKWLFIYPDQGIATVNFVQFPVDTPVNFSITADAPMNSFWMPQLGGQIYAMAGMTTQLHIMADTPGDYRGVSANISGEGFADMKFTARASSQADFTTWLNKTKTTPQHLDSTAYDALRKPTIANPMAYYSHAEPGLYDTIVMKYMMPKHDTSTMEHHEEMH
ncbi:MAG TPA: ubiquinol oxidase subunit II [Candidatus Saccharimonadales bacterium]